RAPRAAFDELTESGEVSARVFTRRAASGLKRCRQYAHPPAADQSVVPAVVVIEAKGGELRLRGVAGEGAQGLALDLGLDAATAESAGLAAVWEDQHGRPGFLRRRPARLDHR